MSGHPTWRFDLMLKNGEFSALVQCDDWIHLAGAPRGKIARKQCDCQEHKRRPYEAGGIACANAVEELRQSAPKQNREHQPDSNSADDERSEERRVGKECR